MNKHVIVVDVGISNIFSVTSALKLIGAQITVTNKPSDLKEGSYVVLPGVGAFKSGMDALAKSGMDDALKDYALKQRPLFGICLGMQMLFDQSEESNYSEGLKIFPGKVNKIVSQDSFIKIPHIGWSPLISCKQELNEFVHKKWVYFLHSYHPEAKEEHIAAQTDYGGCKITAMVKAENIWGCQFHPEKSGPEGLKIIENWLKL
jgi:glutamine amidotransferase